MFTTHFKMTCQPFCEITPVEHLLQDERFSQGLARLQYLAHHGSLALLSGETGVGKSSLLKLFVGSLSRNRYQPLYLHLTHLSTTALLRLIVTTLGEIPKRGKDRLFLQILEKTQKSDLTTVLILDEAHLLEPQALTDLRLLLGSLHEEKTPLKLLLSGQPPLREQLKQASHADLLHRLSVRYHLLPLSREQTASYVDFQMKIAGASSKLFDPEAKSLIHDYAGGFPRQINNIATACLLNAAAKNLQKITEALVNDTLSEFHLP
jgi:general secretion pathway protein A